MTRGIRLSLSMQISAITMESTIPMKLNFPCITSHESIRLMSLPLTTCKYSIRPSNELTDELPAMLYCSAHEASDSNDAKKHRILVMCSRLVFGSANILRNCERRHGRSAEKNGK